MSDQKAFKIVVNGTGTVYEGPDESRAQAIFDSYVEASKTGEGKFGGETVLAYVGDKTVEKFVFDDWDGEETSEATNGSRQWGMALVSNPNAEPPTRPGHGGIWMDTGSPTQTVHESVSEGKCKCGSSCTGSLCDKCKKAAAAAKGDEDDTDESTISETGKTLLEKLADMKTLLLEKDKVSSKQLRQSDRMRKKRVKRGRGINSTAKIRMAAKRSLKKSKAKRTSAKAKLKTMRTKKRRSRIRGK